MNSPLEPVSPSPSTPSSGSPPPDDILVEQAVAATSQHLANLNQTKRRLVAGPAYSRDLKSRRRDEGVKRSFVHGDMGGREGGRKEEFLDMELMDRLKQEFGDPFDESELKALSQ